MNRSRTLIALTLATAASVTATSAFAAPAGKASQPPKSGRWTLSNGNQAQPKKFKLGTMRVTAHHKAVAGFKLDILTGSEEQACGTGKLTVSGKHKIVHGTGTTEEGTHYNEWFVGKNEPSADPVDQPVKVKEKSNTGTHKADLTIFFGGAKGGPTSSGDLEFNDKKLGQCDIIFTLKR